MKHLLVLSLVLSLLLPFFACCNNPANTINADAASAQRRNPAAPRGSTTLPDGLNVEYEYLFNRNAIRDFVVEGSTVLALTESGNLLLLKLPYLELVSERCDTAGAFMLMRDPARRACVCFENGRIARVDLNDLSLTEVAPPSEPIEWAGYNSQGRLWMLLKGEPLKLYNHDTKQEWLAIDRGEHRGGDFGAIHAHLDSQDRLWVGMDEGEFGGSIRMFDGREEQWHKPFDQKCSGVYGFVELERGETLAYGGTSHMGLNSGFIARVDKDGMEFIDKTKKLQWNNERVREDIGIVTQLFGNPFTKDVFMFSMGHLLRKDGDQWMQQRLLDIGYNPGRPDAMGNYPAISCAEFISADNLLISTVRDGFILLTADGERGFARPQQIDTDSLNDFMAMNQGMLLIPCEAQSGSVQRWRDGEIESIEPLPNAWLPYEDDLDGWTTALRPFDEFEYLEEEWYVWRVLLAEENRLLAIAHTNSAPGTSALLAWADGGLIVLKTWASGGFFDAESYFATPDGQIWGPEIREIEEVTGRKQYKLNGVVPERYWRTRVLISDGPPWYIHDQRYGNKAWISRVLRLDVDDDKSSATSTMLFEGEDIQAVCYMEKGALLIAKADRLELWRDGVTTTFVVPGLDVTALNPQSLMRTDDGALWIGGDGLVMVQGEKVQSFSNVPPLKGSQVTRIAQHKADGSTWVALSRRGALRLKINDAE